jgi:polar amino acid transport system ATP-binding protein
VTATSRRLLEATGVSKSFGSLAVLRDVSLAVDRGEKVVVIGPSGSGKSTLLRCLNLLEPIDAGRIAFDGRPISAGMKDAAGVRRELGMVFQNFELFSHLSAAENVMLAPRKVLGRGRDEARAQAERLLAKVHIPEKADSYPDELSGGQQQRIAIARALAMNPRVMLYDEPTSALDPEMIKEVLDVIQELAAEGMTSVVVTHEMGFARGVADRIVFMDEGEVVVDAAKDAFFAGAVPPRAQRFLGQILRH